MRNIDATPPTRYGQRERRAASEVPTQDNGARHPRIGATRTPRARRLACCLLRSRQNLKPYIYRRTRRDDTKPTQRTVTSHNTGSVSHGCVSRLSLSSASDVTRSGVCQDTNVPPPRLCARATCARHVPTAWRAIRPDVASKVGMRSTLGAPSQGFSTASRRSSD
jgi:hypothetical protein